MRRRRIVPTGSAGLTIMVLVVVIACCYCCRGASSFQFPAAATKMNHLPRAYYSQQQHHSHGRMIWTFLSNQEDKHDERANEGSFDEPPTTTTTSNHTNNSRMAVRPSFLARTMHKLMKKNEDSTTIANTDSTSSSSSSSPNALNSTFTADEENDGGIETKVDSQADILHAMAVKTRLEAEKMEVLLTLDKISRLENRVLLSSSNTSLQARVQLPEEERANLIRNVRALMTKLNDTDLATEPSHILSDNNNNNTNNIISDNIPMHISNEDFMISSSQSTELVSLDGNNSNTTTTTTYPVLSYEKQQEAISYFDKLPQPIREMMAKSAGMPTNSNSTAIITQLAEEGRLYESETNDGQFNMIAKAEDVAENADIFIDLEFAEINSFIQTLLPAVTRKEPVPMEYMDAFYAEVLGKDSFQPSERNPRPVPGGYLIRGTSMVKKSSTRKEAGNNEKLDDDDDDDDDEGGDCLMNVIEKKIMASSLANKIRVYYILDPTPPSGEEILNDEDESPVLLVTNHDISPNTNGWVKPTVTFLGLASVAIFSLGAFAFNADIIENLSASANYMELDWLINLSLPLASSLLATQLFHELGHVLVAAKDEIHIGVPTLVPGFQFGLTGGITPIKSPPKNLKSLFDFAVAGPIFGLVASMILLYTGLEMTVFMDASVLEQLPTVPVEILRSSALGGGLIDYLLGDGVLNTPDETQMIKLHPFAISGFSGLVLNALSLLPIGNTDGGRICTTFFGRSFSRIVQGTAILMLVLAGFFGADRANTLLCYAIFCQCFQNESEIPCRNEVDELDTLRGLVAIGLSVIMVLTLTPLP
jgi:hypothetical protein